MDEYLRGLDADEQKGSAGGQPKFKLFNHLDAFGAISFMKRQDTRGKNKTGCRQKLLELKFTSPDHSHLCLANGRMKLMMPNPPSMHCVIAELS